MGDRSSADVSPVKSAAVAAFDVFLSHNSRDKPAVERIAERLKRAGLEPWIDKWCLTPGGRWQQELAEGLTASSACAVFISTADLGDWEREELGVAQNRAAIDRSFRLFAVLLPGLPEPFQPSALPPFLATRMWVDFRRGYDDTRALQSLINAVKGIPLGPETPIDRRSDVCPYQGLQTFDEEHSEFFFGRDADIQRLVEKLKSSRFLAVLGPSGSGKSSLVRAGLVPALRQGALPGSESWTIRVITPGAHPLTAVAAQLLRLHSDQAMQSTVDGLSADERTLHHAVSLALANRHPAERLVWVVDQAEEIFTLCRDEQERARFFDNLLYAVAVPGGQCVVVLTLRADFYAKTAAYPELGQQMATQQFLVGPLDEEGLRQAIEEPARRVGLDLEPGLAGTILDDIALEPGALPLLEHALLELWERRRGTVLTLEGYRESGEVDGALSKRAEAIFTSFSPHEREVARRILLRLTEPGEGAEDTRRRASMAELLTSPAETEAVHSVVRVLTDARLLTTGADGAGGGSVEVSHEALIRGWPQLRQWVEEDRQGLRIHRRLGEAAREWAQLGRDPQSLYRGSRLLAASEWAELHKPDLNQLEREFLTSSHRHEQFELQTTKRRNQRLRLLVLALMLLLVGAAALAIFAIHQTDQANAQNRVAVSQAAAAEANTQLVDRLDRSILLSLEAFHSAPTLAARGSLLRAWVSSELIKTILHIDGYGGAVALAFIDDKTLAVGYATGKVVVWDLQDHRRIRELSEDHSKVLSLAFTPRAKLLASANEDATITIWDTRTWQMTGHMRTSHEWFSIAFNPAGTILASTTEERGAATVLWNVATRERFPKAIPMIANAIVFSPDGKMIAGGSNSYQTTVWDVATRRRLGRPLKDHTGYVNAVAFSPDGRTLASGAWDKTVVLWNVRSRQRLGTPFRGAGDVNSVAFSPDGRTLAAGGYGRRLVLWSLVTHRRLKLPLLRQSNTINSVTFSPDGNTVASADDDGTVMLYDLHAGSSLATPLLGEPHHASSVAFSPNGKLIAGGGSAGTVVWNTTTRRQIGGRLQGTRDVNRVAFSPDGRTLASGSNDAIVVLSDTSSHRPLGTPLKFPAEVYDVAFSPNGKIVAAAGDDNHIYLWDVATHHRLAALKGSDPSYGGVAFNPTGTTIAAGGDRGDLSFWNLPNHKRLRKVAQSRFVLYGLAYSFDGRTLAFAVDQDYLIKFLATASMRSIGEPLRFAHAPTGVAFSRDGRILVSADGDEVSFWDVQTHQLVGQPVSTGHDVNDLAISPDLTTIASAEASGKVLVWYSIPTARDITPIKNRLCRMVGRNLTASEWNEFMPGRSYHKTC